MADWEQKSLISELTQGRELAKQLQIHFNAPSSTHETREYLVQKIQNSFETSLSLLKWSGSTSEPHNTGTGIGVSESPRSLSGSPRSEESDRDNKDLEHNGSRKRKLLPRWTRQVQVCAGMGLEGPLDDGFSWRKYGQKDILGARHPRGYYRCTHRNIQGCLATKQVQRSDYDPTIFEITYRGCHTCNNSGHFPSSDQERTDSKECQKKQTHEQSQGNILNFQTGLTIKSEDLDTHERDFPLLEFPSMENHVFPTSLLDNNFLGDFPPSFASPATSGSNCFTVSPSQITGFGKNQNLQATESDLSEILSAATSTTSSPFISLEHPFGTGELDPNFTFGNSGFYS